MKEERVWSSEQVNLASIIAGVYIAVQMLSDIMSLRILSIWGFSVDGGTIIYPLTFTVRDVLHRAAGKRIARSVIFLAAIVNIFMILMFWLVSILPPDMSVGLQRAFGSVLVPAWRIVVASIIAEVLSELLDGEMYEKWENRFGHRMVWGRVLFSNAFSIPLDSLVFSFLAFYGTMPTSVVVSIFISNVIIKFVVGSASLPLIYVTKKN